MCHDSKEFDYMTFEEVCNELKLKNTPDWGIINSDGSRVIEFINYVTLHETIKSSIQFEFIELIVASMNDAILDGIADCEVHEKFYNYIIDLLHDEKFYPQIQYWISIKSEVEYPVGLLLNDYLEKKSPNN